MRAWATELANAAPLRVEWQEVRHRVQTLAPIMIRRRKSEVLLQLPERTDQNLLVPMTELQMSYHQENAEIVTNIVQR